MIGSVLRSNANGFSINGRTVDEEALLMTTSSQVSKAEKNRKNDINVVPRDALLDIIKEVAKSLIFKGIPPDDNQDALQRCGIICGTPSS